jgi:predicted Zn-dependent peptidase
VLLALESPASRMFRMARTLHLLDRVVTVDETLDAYKRLTLEDVNRLLDEVLTDGDWHVGAVGPATQDELTRLTAR